jgi:DNA invertase Pin-like site-specific DNA recombinase
MKIAIYIRVSTEEQVKEGFSLGKIGTENRDSAYFYL